MEGLPQTLPFIGPGLSPWPSDASSISLIGGRAGLYPKPVTGWAGLGRAGPGAQSPGQRVQAGLALMGSEPPGSRARGDLAALLGSRLRDGWRRGCSSALCPHPEPMPHPHPTPSLGPGAQPDVAGAAATVQRVSQWPVEPHAGVGEGLGRGTPVGAGPGTLGGASAQESLGGNVSKSQDWPRSETPDQSSWPVTLASL